MKSWKPVLRNYDILGWIRIRIRGSKPLTNGSGSGSMRPKNMWIRWIRIRIRIRNTAGNYRPVFLTSVPCKPLETCLKDKWSIWYQTTWQKSQSLDSAKKILWHESGHVYGQIIQSDRRRKVCGHILSGLRKNFRKGAGQKTKEEAEGERSGKNLSMDWKLENWLTGRTQKVKIKGETSASCSVDTRVLQGSVLWPPKFSVYIDDLENQVIELLLEVLVYKFDDDTKGAKVIGDLQGAGGIDARF
jgi:hypothetical protein